MPVLKNTKDISAGKELVVYWLKKEKALSAPKRKTTWQERSLGLRSRSGKEGVAVVRAAPAVVGQRVAERAQILSN